MSYQTYPAWYKRIVRARPARLEVTDSDGKLKKVNVPERKNRWAAIWDTIGALDWAAIEGYDANGDLVVTMSASVAQAEDQEPATEPETTDRTDEVAGLLGLMLQAQESAMSGHERLVQTTMDSLGKVVEMLTERIQSLEQSYWALVSEVSRLAQESHKSEDDESNEMAKMLVEAAAPAFVEKLMGPQQQMPAGSHSPGNGEHGK